MTLELLWLVLTGAMIATYVVLDGFDLGAGILQLAVARTREERDLVVRSVGPVWDGNEVWLVAGGATLFLAFPRLFATAMSGFYLPLMIVLWLLCFRALGIEMRHHFHHPLWCELWDYAFFGASALLAFFFGVALGNVVRGVTFGEDGRFFAPLWTSFGVGGEVGILDWYTALVGALAVAALSMHGAAWLVLRTPDPVRSRSAQLAGRAWVATLALTAATTAATFVVQPRLAENLVDRPWGGALPALSVLALVGFRRWLGRGEVGRAFAASSTFLAALVGSAAFGIYPHVLPAADGVGGLTLSDAAAHPSTLTTALVWWVPGMALAVAYFVFLYRRLPGPATPDEPGH